MSEYYEEEVLGKAYDSKLMRRLLSYARPYALWILAAVLLLLIVTGADLIRPLLIQTAIDNHINAFDTPYVVFNADDGMDGYSYDGKILVRADQLAGSYPDKERYQLVDYQGKYYLVQGVIKSEIAGFVPEAERDYAIAKTAGGFVGTDRDGNSYPAALLSQEQLMALRKPDVDSVVYLTVLFLTLILATFFINYAQVYILNLTSQRIIFSMRMEIFSKLQRLSLSFFEKNPVGRMVTRVTNDTETLNEMYTNVLVSLFKDVFLLVGIIGVMIWKDYRLALISLAVIPFVIAATFIFRAKARDAYRQVRVRLARINASMAENISGMVIVQIFHRQLKRFKEFDAINRSYFNANMQQIKIFAIFRPFMYVLYSLALALLIWYGGGRVLQNQVDLGVLYVFVTYIQMFFAPINDLSEKYNILQSAMASSERIFQLLDRKEDIQNPENPVALPEVKGKIEFKNVWFAYDEGEWVLRDVSFTINRGETVAFVGATGAGKTSIISLISRFYDIQKGSILIDGVDIRNVKKEDLRSHIGVVLQDVFLFSGNIRDNIRLNNQDIDDDRIRKIATYVNASKFINRLAGSFDAEVKERGATFSAGQRQLLAFARALAFDPSILVLDEATANIDTETEELIQDALPKLIAGRTTIIVAHRLSTIQHCDKIIVVHKGKIREVGTHQELLQKGGIYYDLYRLQYKEDFNEENGAAS